MALALVLGACVTALGGCATSDGGSSSSGPAGGGGGPALSSLDARKYADYQRRCSESAKGLATAKLTYQDHVTMSVDKDTPIVIAISLKSVPSAEFLPARTVLPSGDVVSDQFEVTCRVRARLEANDDFEISTLEWREVELWNADTETWRWNVHPVRDGAHVLIADVQAVTQWSPETGTETAMISSRSYDINVVVSAPWIWRTRHWLMTADGALTALASVVGTIASLVVLVRKVCPRVQGLWRSSRVAPRRKARALQHTSRISAPIPPPRRNQERLSSPARHSERPPSA
jgi:hypothetical protein